MTKTSFEFWSLLFVCYLKFVIWNFYSSSAPKQIQHPCRSSNLLQPLTFVPTAE
jgi:hypothetical protein